MARHGRFMPGAGGHAMRHAGERSRWWTGRFVLPAAGMLATIVLALAAELAPAAYTSIMTALITLPGDRAFFDWAYVADHLACARAGTMIFAAGGCSTGFVYSPAFLLLPPIPTGPVWDRVIGFSLAGLFFASLAALRPATSRSELAIRLIATLSPATALGVERGNVDLTMFVLLVAGAGLIVARRSPVVGYGLVVVAGLLKLYPFAALVIALREHWLALVGIALVAALSLGSLWLAYGDELQLMVRNLPKGGIFTIEFTAREIPKRLAELIPSSRALIVAAWAMLILLTAMGAVALMRRYRSLLVAIEQHPFDYALLVMGSAVFLFCFVVGQNFLYRAVFLLPVLAGLFAIRDAASGRRQRMEITGACVLVAAVLWLPFYQWLLAAIGLWDAAIVQMTMWLLAQLAWWTIASIVSAVLLAFAIDRAGLERRYIRGLA